MSPEMGTEDQGVTTGGCGGDRESSRCVRNATMEVTRREEEGQPQLRARGMSGGRQSGRCVLSS